MGLLFSNVPLSPDSEPETEVDNINFIIWFSSFLLWHVKVRKRSMSNVSGLNSLTEKSRTNGAPSVPTVSWKESKI